MQAGSACQGRVVESGVPFVYILRCRDGSLYTGAARDLERRFSQHRAGRASRYTRSRLPVVLVWWREMEGWGETLREELRIKALRRDRKEAMVLGEGAEPAASQRRRG